MIRASRVLMMAAGLLVMLSGVAGARPRQDEASTPRRILIFSAPGLTWDESAEHDLPALDDFFADAALADLAPRSVASRSDPGEAYLTISAGTRATSEADVDGGLFEVQEGAGLSGAAEIFVRRTGIEPNGEYVTLGWPTLLRENDGQPYDAVLGLLAETLGDEGVGTAVIGNADGSDSTGTSFQRQVGLALADTDGVMAEGDLSTQLLSTDPTRPFGYRLDHEAVVASFAEAWGPADGADGRVVVVEASDLARTLRYRPLVDEDRYTELRDQALADADALFAALVADVDPTRDAVMVVAPYGEADLSGLTVAALRTPTTEPGFLRSASTQREGIVTLVDVAPSILNTLDIPRPVEMEGRQFEASTSNAPLDERRDLLVSISNASRFRTQLLFPTTIFVVLVLTGVTAFATVVIAGRWSDRARRAVRFAALANLAVLPMSYVARAFPLEELGSGFYWALLVVTSLVTAVVVTVVTERARKPLLDLAVMLVLILAVLIGDVMTGSNLHMSAAFGYSPTGNSRLYGISNYSFGQVAASMCLLAALVTAAWPTARGRASALGLMGAVVVVLGVPFWGSDVGGVLAFTPTVLLFAALLYRYRMRLRSLVIGGLVTVATVTAFGLVDLARPAEQRAHLGRLFERIANEGLQPLLSIVERKLFANLRVSTSSFWVAAIPIGVAFWLFLSRFPSRPLSRVTARIPTLRAGLVAAVVAAVLGSLLNDSGAIVGGVTVLVVTASLAYLALVDPLPAQVPDVEVSAEERIPEPVPARGPA